MKRYYISILKVLVLALTLLQSKTAHAQELAFLNKFYFPISDTTKFQPKFYQQSLDRRDSLIVGIYTMDHMLAMRKVVYYDKDKKEISRKEFHYDSLERLERFIEFNKAMDYENRVEFYPEGRVKSKRLSRDGQNLKIECFDEMGNFESCPIEATPIPYKGAKGWYSYLMSSLRFPEKARRTERSGTVYIYFEVDKEGNIANPEIMNPEEVFPSLAKEALRVVNSYPHKWLPGEKDGEAVSTFLSLPISFKVP